MYFESLKVELKIRRFFFSLRITQFFPLGVNAFLGVLIRNKVEVHLQTVRK